jgi:hypothetical protein
MTESEREPKVPDASEEFVREAAEKPPGLVREFLGFLKQNGNWWLTPLILVLLVVGILVVLSSTVLGPFIYPLF